MVWGTPAVLQDTVPNTSHSQFSSVQFIPSDSPSEFLKFSAVIIQRHNLEIPTEGEPTSPVP